MTADRYHGLLVTLHWVIALIIFLMLAVGIFGLDPLPNDDPDKVNLLRMHFLGGITLLVLMLVRIPTRFFTKKPPTANPDNRFLRYLAGTIHVLLYLVILGLISTGLGLAQQSGLPEVIFGPPGTPLPESFEQFDPWRGHVLMTNILIGLIVIHIIGVVYHQFVKKDKLLSRMSYADDDNE